MSIRLIVGLGNPGPRYENTRHNVGFMLLDRLKPGRWHDWKGLGQYAESASAMLAQPLTFMNNSGQMVQSLAAYHKIAPDEILVCFDELSIPLGTLRLRKSGSAGGHNGMKSVLEHLGTQEVPRLRVGIGPLPPGRDATDFVLARFGKAEKADLDDALARAQEAAALACAEGMEPAMNKYNRAAQEE